MAIFTLCFLTFSSDRVEETSKENKIHRLLGLTHEQMEKEWKIVTTEGQKDNNSFQLTVA